MGGVCCGEHNARTKADRKISKVLAREKRRKSDEVCLLLLGPGESGKSTVLKQMTIIDNLRGFRKEVYRETVFSNCITQMKVLVDTLLKLGIPVEDENKEYVKKINNINENGDVWSAKVALMIKELWADKGIKRVFTMRDSYYQLNDTAAYFFNNVERFGQADYVPTVDDILRTRVRTVGVNEVKFRMEDFIFKMVDVGGQRCERRKW
eukprot:CAMPEP_0168522918 /NCGR_PEP_ID=MMETSP0405-20121227/9645_1 /TAXON_ID=498012 /ORGANISM="Trichosphaerium sp, Strain Am-I-7 wt" /LENGTH=207 /DNA_ID=CAMNT_0008544635 /DNA_START=78 /DNA_END=698 /DNA_ORIENTATION=+